MTFDYDVPATGIMHNVDERFSRNLGLIDGSQQAALAAATVLVCGCGGMGGVCAEVLARLGVGGLELVDHDAFELSNTNRQLHAREGNYGRNKATVLAEEVRRINPHARVRAHEQGVTPGNVAALLDGVDVVVNGMDRMFASLHLERTARARGRTIVDAWLTPYASVFVMRPDSPHWEEYLDLPTRGVPLDQLNEDLCRQALDREIRYTLAVGEPDKHFDRTLVDDVVQDRRPRPSLAPVVWLTGVMMANEVFKLLVGLPTTDHLGVFYDQYEHRVLRPRI